MFKNHIHQLIVSMACLLVTTYGYTGDQGASFSYPHHQAFQVDLGGFAFARSSATQHVDIDSLIGDDFTPSSDIQWNGLLGLGYYLSGPQYTTVDTLYGIHAFYLPKTTINGTVLQEGLFINLAYSYSMVNWPIYFTAKAKIHHPYEEKYQTFVEVGVGPDIIQTQGFSEASLDNGVTIPDNIFSGRTAVSVAATVGVGLIAYNAFGKTPLQCGYQFMYFGPTTFHHLTDQTSSLSTGKNFANAVMCSIIL
jgi:hypothetical protein